MESGSNSDGDNAGGLRPAPSGILKIYLELLRGKPELQTRETIANIAKSCKVPVDVVYKHLGIEGGDVDTSRAVDDTNEVGGAYDMAINEASGARNVRSKRHGTNRRAPAPRVLNKYHVSED